MTLRKEKYINEITKQTFYMLSSACNFKDEIITLEEYNIKSLKAYLSGLNLEETLNYFAQLGNPNYWTVDDVNNLIESPSLLLCCKSSEILNFKYSRFSFLSYSIDGKNLIDILYNSKGRYFDLIKKEKKIKLREILQYIYKRQNYF